MGGIPFTKTEVSPEREAAIRAAVRSTASLPSTAVSSRLATIDDTNELLGFLQHPEVNKWIYSLPRPLNVDTVRELISDAIEAQQRGEGLLSLNFDEGGAISGYSDAVVWPQWAAGELAGAMRPDLQSKGQGASGMSRTFTWMFEALDLDLICNTTALDNIRMQKIFARTGFEYKGDTESVRPDGSIRASQIWEITRSAWLSGPASGA